MRDSEFKIEELNPFQEWHLHGSANSQEQALHRAQDICRQIGRPVRIRTATNKLVAQFDPSEELPTKQRISQQTLQNTSAMENCRN